MGITTTIIIILILQWLHMLSSHRIFLLLDSPKVSYLKIKKAFTASWIICKRCQVLRIDLERSACKPNRTRNLKSSSIHSWTTSQHLWNHKILESASKLWNSTSTTSLTIILMRCSKFSKSYNRSQSNLPKDGLAVIKRKDFSLQYFPTIKKASDLHRLKNMKIDCP